MVGGTNRKIAEKSDCRTCQRSNSMMRESKVGTGGQAREVSSVDGQTTATLVAVCDRLANPSRNRQFA
jgi:hypothetical protein